MYEYVEAGEFVPWWLYEEQFILDKKKGLQDSLIFIAAEQLQCI